MNSKYIQKHHRIVGLIGAGLAAVIAVIFLGIVPEEAAAASGVQKLVLLYAHSLCWILLATASFIWALKSKNRWSEILAYTALAVYCVFMATLLMV